MNALVKTQPAVPAEASMVMPQNGAALYRISTDAAALCRDIVVATASNIQGRKYVQVEGWQAIALAHGCVASSGDVTQHPDGSVSAIGRVVRIDTGTLIASAEGYVGADEATWFGGTVTDRYGKTKTLPKRPDYAIRAMAQTRAISRACRSAFAHVVVMMNANLSTTPAEEVPDGGFGGHDTQPSPEQKPMGIKEWLDALERDVKAAVAVGDTEALLAILDREDVKTGVQKATGKAADRLHDILIPATKAQTPQYTAGPDFMTADE